MCKNVKNQTGRERPTPCLGTLQQETSKVEKKLPYKCSTSSLPSKSCPSQRMEKTSVRTDRLHKAGGGLITLIRDNITFTTTDIPSTINTHNIELQMVKVYINNTKHITIANIYIPPRDTTSTHYKTA